MRTQAVFSTVGFIAGLTVSAAIAPCYGDVPPDVDRTVVVMFMPQSIALPEGVDSSTIEEANIPSIDLGQFLVTSGVEQVARSFPDFELADTLAIGPTGDAIRIPDYSRVYQLLLPIGADVDQFIADL